MKILFRGAYGVNRLLLHAHSLAFTHPVTGRDMYIEAPLDEQWRVMLAALRWESRATSDRPANDHDATKLP